MSAFHLSYPILKTGQGSIILTILQYFLENLAANAEPACPLVPFEDGDY